VVWRAYADQGSDVGASGDRFALEMDIPPRSPLQPTENFNVGAVAESAAEGGSASELNLGRLPVESQLAVQYMPVHPRISDQKWNIQVQITPVILKPIKGALFE
jgi:hypothetical protein